MCLQTWRQKEVWHKIKDCVYKYKWRGGGDVYTNIDNGERNKLRGKQIRIWIREILG